LRYEPRARHNLLLKNVRTPGHGVVNVLVSEGIIADISADEPTAPNGVEVVDAGGDLICPGLIDRHLHLDKTLIGLPWMPHSAGPTRQDRIKNDKSIMPTLPLSVEVRASNLVRQAITKGTTHMRSHVDVTNEVGLDSLRAVMKVREKFADTMDIQIVAFPQDGVVSSPGTIELLEAAIGEGAEFIGGIDPAVIDRYPVGQLDALFAAAERTSAGIDIHLHEPGKLGNFNIGLICERMKALGMEEKVTVSHGFALGAINDATFEQTSALMAEAGVSVMTFGPGSSPMLPLKKLAIAGVKVFAGSDAIRDSW
jgi:cytosine deaminase